MTHSLSCNIDRFWETIEASARIGAGRPGGLSRLALTDADREVRDLFASWCREAGLTLTIDTMGNMFARREGRENLPPVLVGSHLDTQANGGRFDGIAGVMAGLEIVRTLNDAGIVTRRPIEVVNWTNEEGGRFSPPMVSSGVFSGAYDLAWAHARPSDDGPTQGEELKRIGYLGETPCGGREIDAYFELHIEQGPRLHAEGVPVGVVTGGFSVNGWRIGIAGETAHAGPWPMEKRRNALVGAARLAVAIDDIGHAFAKERAKGTAARIVATPNKAGILSDEAEFTGDIRHPTAAGADAMAAAFEAAIGECARAANVEMTVLDRWVWRDIVFDADLIGMIRKSAAGRGFATLDLMSEAGHDAYFMRRVCPTAMIFTPCRDGITHNNAEFTTKEEQAPGLQVLLDCVLARADRP